MTHKFGFYNSVLMKTIYYKQIIEAVSSACKKIVTILDREIVAILRSYENSKVLEMMLKNIELAEEENLPICQDTGTVVVFAEVGQQVHIEGGNFEEAIHCGVRDGYQNFRKSIVAEPLFDRVNTNDNTPAIIHTKIVDGDSLRLLIMAKGGGSENKSTIKIFAPTATHSEIEDFVVDWIASVGAAACPPYIIGLGIGGNFEQSAILAKRALVVPLRGVNPLGVYDEMEKSILDKIQKLKIGPQGLGKYPTALGVKILHAPCHIASLPVAINLGCYVHRHCEVVL